MDRSASTGGKSGEHMNRDKIRDLIIDESAIVGSSFVIYILFYTFF